MPAAADSSLAETLGIEAGTTVSIFNSPNYFDLDLGELPDDVEIRRDAEDAPSDLLLIFADRSDEAQRGFERAVTNMSQDGVIWFAWPEVSTDRASDLDESTLKDLFRPHGMVPDERAVLIDEDWRGQRFTVAQGAEWPPTTD